MAGSLLGVVLFVAGVRVGRLVASGRAGACRGVYDVSLAVATVFAVASCVCGLACVPGFAMAWLVTGWVLFGGVAVGVAWSD